MCLNIKILFLRLKKSCFDLLPWPHNAEILEGRRKGRASRTEDSPLSMRVAEHTDTFGLCMNLRGLQKNKTIRLVLGNVKQLESNDFI